MKKVVFIGGTSYSGTTLLDMIIANDRCGFSCGELSSLFKKEKKNHLNFECGCGNMHCKIWNEVLKKGKNKVYETIFTIFPHIDSIIDSSKDPFWIKHQMDVLKSSDIKIKNILIFKTPYESAHSFKKRGRLHYFEKSWVNYHRLYFTLVKKFITLEYSKLVSNAKMLQKICGYLEIPFFEGKEKYWEKSHHTLFGNTSAKMHLFSESCEAFNAYKIKLTKSGRNEDVVKKEFKKVYYKKINDQKLKIFVNDLIIHNFKIRLIEEVLRNNQLSEEYLNKKKHINKNLIDQLKVSSLQLKIRLIRNYLRVKSYNIMFRTHN